MRRIGITRIVAVIIALLAVSIAAGCNKSEASAASPSAAVKAFFEATKNKDCEKAVAFFDYSAFEKQGITVDREEEVQKCKEGLGQSQDDQNEIIDYKIIEEKIDGERAEVNVDITMKWAGEEQTERQALTLKRTDGNWRVLIGTR